jgi:hypothetical protein
MVKPAPAGKPLTAKKYKDLGLWRRRLRDLIGHGEGIMDLTDSLADDLEQNGSILSQSR